MLDDDEVKAWKLDDKGMIFLPGITFEEFQEAWDAAVGVQRRSMFYLGDAINAGEQFFGESFNQVLGDQYRPETIRSAAWVAKKIEPARRRPDEVAWSVHQAVASLPPEAQSELLELAVKHGWSTAATKEEVARRKHPTNGPPPADAGSDQHDDDDDEQEQEGAPADHVSPGVDQKDTQEAEQQESSLPGADDAEEDAAQAGADQEDDEAPEPPAAAPWSPFTVLAAPVGDLAIRECIEALRAAAPLVLTNTFDTRARADLNTLVMSTAGLTPSPFVDPTRTEKAAFDLVPRRWDVRIDATGRDTISPSFAVDARVNNHRAIGVSPVLCLALCEAALTAIMIDRSEPTPEAGELLTG